MEPEPIGGIFKNKGFKEFIYIHHNIFNGPRMPIGHSLNFRANLKFPTAEAKTATARAEACGGGHMTRPGSRRVRGTRRATRGCEARRHEGHDVRGGALARGSPLEDDLVQQPLVDAALLVAAGEAAIRRSTALGGQTGSSAPCTRRKLRWRPQLGRSVRHWALRPSRQWAVRLRRRPRSHSALGL